MEPEEISLITEIMIKKLDFKMCQWFLKMSQKILNISPKILIF
jgi:hypothetical protein